MLKATLKPSLDFPFANKSFALCHIFSVVGQLGRKWYHQECARVEEVSLGDRARLYMRSYPASETPQLISQITEAPRATQG